MALELCAVQWHVRVARGMGCPGKEKHGSYKASVNEGVHYPSGWEQHWQRKAPLVCAHRAIERACPAPGHPAGAAGCPPMDSPLIPACIGQPLPHPCPGQPINPCLHSPVLTQQIHHCGTSHHTTCTARKWGKDCATWALLQLPLAASYSCLSPKNHIQTLVKWLWGLQRSQQAFEATHY